MAKTDNWKGTEFQKYFLFYKMFKKIEGSEYFVWAFEESPNGDEADFIVQNEYYESKTGVKDDNSIIKTNNAIPPYIKKAIQQLYDGVKDRHKTPFIITNRPIQHGEFILPSSTVVKVSDIFGIKADLECNGKIIPIKYIKTISIITYPVKDASTSIELDKMLKKELDTDYLNDEYGIDINILRTIKQNFISNLVDKQSGNSSEIELLSYYSAMIGNPNIQLYDEYSRDETQELINVMKEEVYYGNDVANLKTIPKYSKYIRLIDRYLELREFEQKIEKILRRTND